MKEDTDLTMCEAKIETLVYNHDQKGLYNIFMLCISFNVNIELN